MSAEAYVPAVVTFKPVKLVAADVTAKLYCCKTTLLVPTVTELAPGSTDEIAIEGTADGDDATVISSNLIECLEPVWAADS